uniref:Histonelysine Nmethyltransferase putative n=1 Tax=Albugo laibachii Nc14 TaxID=890382 RepID=F0WZ66_9STRA|nr:histonelysine Nmethyltransferase putative [Albugo laibachii Nc14]|eukprot:CCA26782.1 histonelysine Nmethyltransferase putative [Albugo laibachii Nc14]
MDSLLIPFAAYIANEHTQELSDSDSSGSFDSGVNFATATQPRSSSVLESSFEAKEPVRNNDNNNFALESESQAKLKVESEVESDTPKSDSETQKFIEKCSCCHQFRLISDQQALCIHCEAAIVHTRCFHRWFHERSQHWPYQITNQIGPQWKAHAQLLKQKQLNASAHTRRTQLKPRTSERSTTPKIEPQWTEWLLNATKTLIFCADCVHRQLISCDQKEGFIAHQLIGQVDPLTLELQETKQTLTICSQCHGSFCISSDLRGETEFWECIHCSKTPFTQDFSEFPRPKKPSKQRKNRLENVKRVGKKVKVKREVVKAKVETPIQWPQPIVVREDLLTDSKTERFMSLNKTSLHLAHGILGENEAIHITPNGNSEEALVASLKSAFRPSSREPDTVEEPNDVLITCDDCQETYQLVVGKASWTGSSFDFDDKEDSDRQTEASCGVLLTRALDPNATVPPCSPWFCVTCLKRMKRSRKRKRFRYSKQMLLAMEVFGKRLEIYTKAVPEIERSVDTKVAVNRWLGTSVLIFSPIDRVWLQGHVDSCMRSEVFDVVFKDGSRQSLPLDSLPVLHTRLNDPLVQIDKKPGLLLARLLHTNKWAQHILSDEFSNTEPFFLVQLLYNEDLKPLGEVHYVPKGVCRPYDALPPSPLSSIAQRETQRIQQHVLGACRQTAVRFPHLLLHAKLCLSKYADDWAQVMEYDASSRKFTLGIGLKRERISDTQLSAQLTAVDTLSLHSKQNICSGCRLPSMDSNQSLLSCQRCNKRFHATCTDPPYVDTITVWDPHDHSELDHISLPFTCADCDVCAGCNQNRTENPWVRWRLPLTIVSLCGACELLYRSDQFCSICYRALEALTPRKELSLLSCSSCRHFVHPECELQTVETSTIAYKSTEDRSEAQTALKSLMEEAFSVPVVGIPIPSIDLWAPEPLEPKTSEEITTQLTFDSASTQLQQFECLRCRQAIALGFIKKLAQQDKLQVFSCPVTRDIAPASYFEIIKEPMDVATMRHKVLTVDGYVDTRFQALQDDFELICFNAVTFNSKENDFWIWREAWRFYGKGLKLARQSLGTEHMYGDKYLALMLQAAQRQLPPNSGIKRALLQRHAKLQIVDNTPTESPQEVPDIDVVPSASKPAKIWTPQTELRPLRISLWEYQQTPIVMRWTRSFAHTYAWLDLCVVCASAGSASSLLFCMDCAQTVHTFCVLSDTSAWNKFNAFHCPNCLQCRVCDETEGVLACPKCGKGAHGACLDPPIDDPSAIYCGECVECKHCQTPGTPRTYSLVPDLCLQCCSRQERWKSARQFTKPLADKCPICLETCNVKEAIHCDACERWTHSTCDPMAFRDKDALYVCPSCRMKERVHLNAKNCSLVDQRARWRLQIAIADTQSARKLCHAQWKQGREHVALMRRWKHCQAHVAIYLHILRLGDQCLTKLALQNGSKLHIDRIPQWLLAKANRYIRYKRYARGPRASERKARKQEQLYSQELETCRPDAMASIVSQASSCAAFLTCVHLLYGHPKVTPVVLHVLGVPVDNQHANRKLPEDILQALLPTVHTQILDEEILTIKNQYARRNTHKSAPKEPQHHILPLLPSIDARACVLCAEIGDHSTCGRLLYLADVQLWAHVFCALWAFGSFFDSNQKLIAKCAHARSKSRLGRCHVCGLTGASIVCAQCPRRYHFKCAVTTDCVFSSSWSVSCSTHAEALIESVHPIMEIGQVRMDSAVFPASIDAKYTAQTLCYRVGTLTAHSLGRIVVGNPHFHSRTAIFPLGFRSTRIFWSICGSSRCLYECVIRQTEEPLSRPVFQIVSDNLTGGIEACSAELAIEMLYKRIGKSYRLCGAEFFGFGRREIAREIELLPSAATTAIPSHRFWAPEVDTSQVYEFAHVLPSSIAMKSAMEEVQTALSLEHRALASTGAARTDGLSVTGGKHAGAHAHMSRSFFGAKQTSLPSEKLPVHAGAIQASSSATQTVASGVMMDMEHLPMAMQYRELRRRPFHDRLKVCKSAIHGYGLFTKEALSEGQAIVEYQGELISQQVADVREALYEEMGVGSCYLFRLDATTIIDATTRGNLARFINHSCDPKAFARSVIVENDKKKILIFAKRAIMAGEEITYDYKFPIEEEALRCDCGAPNCVGRMN